MTRFKTGATLPIRGLRLLIKHPALWPLIIIPWLIDAAILIAGWVQGFMMIQATAAALVTSWLGGGWLFTVLYYPLLIIFVLAFLILWLIVVMTIAAVIASPFTTVLVEMALRRQGVATVSTQSMSAWASHSLRMLKISLMKLVVFCFAGLILFGLSFIPGVNLVAAYASMCLFAADAFDYSFEAMGYNWARRRQELRAQGMAVAGLGATFTLTSLLPGLTVFAMPVAALGASTLIGRPKS